MAENVEGTAGEKDFDFEINSDTGELERVEIEVDEKVSEDEVTRILSGDRKEVETPKEEKKNEYEERFKGLQSKLTPVFQENARLKERLSALESKVTERETKETSAEKDAKQKEEDAKFEESLSAELEAIDNLDLSDSEKRSKFLSVIGKAVEKGINAKLVLQEEKNKTTVEASKEAEIELKQTIEHYNGEDGVPVFNSMEPLVNWLSDRFGDDVMGYPIPVVFKAAENVPFMVWIDQKYPDRAKNLNFAQMCLASEQLRKAYYQNNPQFSDNPHAHLSFLNKERKSNEGVDVNRLREQANNVETERSSGISVEDSSLVKSKEVRPKTAREVIERTLSQLGGS